MVDIKDLKDVAEKAKDIGGQIKDRTTDFSGSKTRKGAKGIVGIVILILLGAFGLELTNNDWDLGKLLSGSSVKESKVLRDKDGNIVDDPALGKATDEYNCDDFESQPQAQNFFIKAGGPSQDTNRLDGDNDTEACEQLPKGEQASDQE
ncbi:MAG: hypothetical protein R3B41_00015 [Candidatus Doudnabacteria bacterium]